MTLPDRETAAVLGSDCSRTYLTILRGGPVVKEDGGCSQRAMQKIRSLTLPPWTVPLLFLAVAVLALGGLAYHRWVYLPAHPKVVEFAYVLPDEEQVLDSRAEIHNVIATVKNGERLDWLTYPMAAGSQFVMPLFWVLSGVSTCFALGAHPAGAFVKRRLARLLDVLIEDAG